MDKGLVVDIEGRPNGIVNSGTMGPEEVVGAMRESRAVLGLGNTWWSPSPIMRCARACPSYISSSDEDESS